MLFNSYAFLLFLPTVVVVYFLLNRHRLVLAAKTWLLLASLFFYAYWDISFLWIILTSIAVNYATGASLGSLADGTGKSSVSAKAALTFGILFNLGMLCAFKYTDFVIQNASALMGEDYPLFNIVLPLGISFFTFQQISFLVDSYRGEVKEYDLLNYSLFISFFPQLIAGPIVHHKEMMPQFNRLRNLIPNYQNIYRGLMLFSIGLFKKCIIADHLAQWANYGFAHASGNHLVDGWSTSLAFTFQLYFDFSGYMDMATGAALMLNIVIPKNFSSPYKALSIRDFWRRWHITLGRFLTDYLYIPLGGNRKGSIRTGMNYLIVFTLGGFWHGAGWTFIVWGAINGLGLIIHTLWQRTGFRLPTPAAWFITFSFTNFCWVFFRADTMADAIGIVKSMVGTNGFALHPYIEPHLSFLAQWGIDFTPFAVGQSHGTAILALFLVACTVIVLRFPTSRSYAFNAQPRLKNNMATATLLACGILSLSSISEFIYFQF